MFYLIFDCLLVVCGGFGGYFIGRRSDTKNALSKRERTELEAKRDLVSTLTQVSMNNIESEPLAQIVLDEIRASGRKEIR